MLQFVNTCSRKYANLESSSSSSPVAHPAQKAALLSCLHSSASPDHPSPLGGEVLGKSALVPRQDRLSQGPWQWEDMCLWVGKASSRLGRGWHKAERYGVGLGWASICAPLEVVSGVEGTEGGREGRRGSLDPFCTCPVLKPGRMSHHGGSTTSCCEAWGKRWCVQGPRYLLMLST